MLGGAKRVSRNRVLAYVFDLLASGTSSKDPEYDKHD